MPRTTKQKPVIRKQQNDKNARKCQNLQQRKFNDKEKCTNGRNIAEIAGAAQSAPNEKEEERI